MLIKKFINSKQIKALLTTAKCVNYNQPAFGTNAFVYNLENLINDDYEKIVKKGKKLFQKILPDYNFYRDQSYFFNVSNNGWVSAHDDMRDAGFFQNTTLVILLQKPENGGNILHGNKRIIMDVGDAFVLNESILHGLETVKGDTSFRAIVLWFKKTL